MDISVSNKLRIVERYITIVVCVNDAGKIICLPIKCDAARVFPPESSPKVPPRPGITSA